MIYNPTWVVREVQSFEYMELPSVSLHSSMTIDGDALIAKQSGATSEIRYVDFPLGLFPKTLFGSFSVCDASGRSLPLMGSRYDSFVAVGVMLHELKSYSVDTELFSDALTEKLFRIANRQDGDGVPEYIERMARDGRSINARRDERAIDVQRNIQMFGLDLHTVLSRLNEKSSNAFTGLMWELGVQFAPIVRMPVECIEPAFVVKYSEVTHSPEMGLLKGSRSYLLNPRGGVIDIEGVNVGRPGSQHFRALAPDGTVITEADIIDPDTGLSSAHEHIVHVTPRWATFYTNYSCDSEQGPQNIRLTVIPDARPVVFPAVMALLLTIFIVGAGVVLQIADMTNSDRQASPRLDQIAAHSSGAIVALFILLPSLFMLSIFRKGEHGLASTLLRKCRRVILASSAVAIASCIPITFSVGSRIVLYVWVLTFLISICSLVVISRHWHCFEQIRKSAGEGWNRDQCRGGAAT